VLATLAVRWRMRAARWLDWIHRCAGSVGRLPANASMMISNGVDLGVVGANGTRWVFVIIFGYRERWWGNPVTWEAVKSVPPHPAAVTLDPAPS
jgi:hypothetical protein